MSYNFQIAKDLLTDSEKNRLVCLYLNCEPTSIKWDKATAEFGAKTVDSMKVSTRYILKKIEAAGGKEGVEATTTPAKRTKRKVADVEDTPTPAPKKRGWKSKKAPTRYSGEAEDDEEDVPKVKPEPEVEGEVEAQADDDV